MTAAKQVPLVSVEEYLESERASATKHEYLGGYLHAMAGGKTRHNRIKGNVFAAFHLQLAGKPCEPFDSDMKVKIQTAGLTRFYYPDVMVVCEPNDDESVYQEQPVVLVEVISESTRRSDVGEKLDAYLTVPTLAAYLLIETDKPSISVYRRHSKGMWDGAFSPELYAAIDAVIQLDEVGAELPLSSVYDRIDFPSE